MSKRSASTSPTPASNRTSVQLPTTSSRGRSGARRGAAAALLLALLVGLASAQDDVRAYELPGENVFPEGIAVHPDTGRFFVGSSTTGTIYRGDVGGEADPEAYIETD